MSQRKKTHPSVGSIFGTILVALLLILIFIATLGTAIFLLTGNDFDFESVTTFQGPTPSPNPTPTIAPKPLVTPVAASMTSFRSVALGFAIDYPADWQKKEKTLQIIFSPSSAGLDSDNLQDAALWVGIPADDGFEAASLLADLLAHFPANAKTLNIGPMDIASQSWRTTQISFEDEQLGGAGVAMLAATNRNKVGYRLVAVAPAQQWSSVQPIFQGMLNSFRFIEEIVIRPTDATPPPTPTPTPTPQIYIVQSGDTLSHIAVNFGVTIQDLVNRNGLDQPEYLRTGQKLIIPTKKK